MTVYLVPKSRLVAKATSLHQHQWATKWSLLSRRPFTKSHYYFNSNGTNSKQSQTGKQVGGYLSWQSVFLRWTPLGVVLVAAAQWHLHNREQSRQGLPLTAPHWQTTFYCSLPLRIMSRSFGWIAERQLPEYFRPTVYGLYSTAFGVNIDEAEIPDFKHYRSLSEFFTRTLRNDVRIISPDVIVSPCDGRVLHLGPVTSDTHLEQVKGVTYSLESFLGPSTKSDGAESFVESLKHKKEGTSLYHCIIYLAPGDYHRFHSPANWKPELRRHFHGELLSVSPKVAKWVPGLFALNERAAYLGSWEHGFFSFTAVGATNVGSVQVYRDEELRTNKWCGVALGKLLMDCDQRKMPESLTMNKGELVGQFNMGSTIVLVFEAPKNFKFKLSPGERVQLGDSLGCFNDDETDSGMESEE